MLSTLLLASQANEVSLPLSPLQVSKFGLGSIGDPNALHATVPSGAKYQWQLCTAKGCIAIKGATKPTLKLLRSYAGKSVRVRETLHGKTVFSRKLKVRAA